jgi:hypothetical protein
MPREARFRGSCIVGIAQLGVLAIPQSLSLKRLPDPLHRLVDVKLLESARKVVRGLVRMQIGGIRG